MLISPSRYIPIHLFSANFQRSHLTWPDPQKVSTNSLQSKYQSHQFLNIANNVIVIGIKCLHLRHCIDRSHRHQSIAAITTLISTLTCNISSSLFIFIRYSATIQLSSVVVVFSLRFIDQCITVESSYPNLNPPLPHLRTLHPPTRSHSHRSCRNDILIVVQIITKDAVVPLHTHFATSSPRHVTCLDHPKKCS